jgi:hypothetical protein
MGGRTAGGSDGRGVGFYFRNVTELILFGVRGKNARTLKPGRTQVNYLSSRKREHSRKPDEQYEILESCSRGPYLELFARGEREGWTNWGNQADEFLRAYVGHLLKPLAQHRCSAFRRRLEESADLPTHAPTPSATARLAFQNAKPGTFSFFRTPPQSFPQKIYFILVTSNLY